LRLEGVERRGIAGFAAGWRRGLAVVVIGGTKETADDRGTKMAGGARIEIVGGGRMKKGGGRKLSVDFE
jgi:hypothetical protein